jgi:hypothetical protein
MNPARLRKGELAALLGAAVLLTTLFLDWFRQPLAQDPEGAASVAVGQTGFEALGIPWLLIALLPVALAGALAVSTAAPRPVAWSVIAGVATAFVSILVIPLLLLRTFVLQPDDNGTTTVEPAAYVGLLALALLALGAWVAMGDERQDAAQSAVDLPPARPVPGA